MAKRRSRDAETLTDEELCAAIDDSGHIKFTLRRKRPAQQPPKSSDKQTETNEDTLLVLARENSQQHDDEQKKSLSSGKQNDDFNDDDNIVGADSLELLSNLPKRRSIATTTVTTTSNVISTTKDNSIRPVYSSAIARRRNSTITIGDESYSMMMDSPLQMDKKLEKSLLVKHDDAKLDELDHATFKSTNTSDQVNSIINRFNRQTNQQSMINTQIDVATNNNNNNNINSSQQPIYSVPNKLNKTKISNNNSDDSSHEAKNNETKAIIQLEQISPATNNCHMFNNRYNRRHSTTGIDRIPRNFFKFGCDNSSIEHVIVKTFNEPTNDAENKQDTTTTISSSSSSSSISKDTVKSMIARLQQQPIVSTTQQQTTIATINRAPLVPVRPSIQAAKLQEANKFTSEEIKPNQASGTSNQDLGMSAGGSNDKSGAISNVGTGGINRAKPVAAIRKVNTIIAANIDQQLLDGSKEKKSSLLATKTTNNKQISDVADHKTDRENATPTTTSLPTDNQLISNDTNNNMNNGKCKPKPAPPVKPATLSKNLNLVNSNSNLRDSNHYNKSSNKKT